jgi:Xaa-Pro dipeptidase
VSTDECGSYFCRSYLEGYYLSQPKYARFIDREVLERFYPVGGVRIEDDILVTEDGNENLTTAPKGQELLDIINGEYELV